MPRGGKRLGAGGQFKWIHGKTKTIRVPEALAEQILEFAQKLDEGSIIEHDTWSKVLDLSEISVSKVDGKSVVFLEALIKAGYLIKPDFVADQVLTEMYRTTQRNYGQKSREEYAPS